MPDLHDPGADVTEWVIPPAAVGGYGLVVDGGRVVDCELGTRGEGDVTMNPFAASRCPHGLNPIACLPCHKAKQAAAPAAAPVPRQPVRNPIVEEMRRRIVGGMTGVGGQPQAPAPVHLGTTPDGTPVTPSSGTGVRGREPIVGKMPTPPTAAGAPAGQAPAQGSAPVAPQPFSYEGQPGAEGRIDRAGVWHPPRRPSITDRLPTHPDPGGKTGRIVPIG